MHIVIAISKKMKHNNGTELIKRAVFLSDMVIANILLTVILLACPSILPVGLNVKMIYFIALHIARWPQREDDIFHRQRGHARGAIFFLQHHLLTKRKAWENICADT